MFRLVGRVELSVERNLADMAVVGAKDSMGSRRKGTFTHVG